MPVPVGGEAGFELEPLAGKALVEHGSAATKPILKPLQTLREGLVDRRRALDQRLVEMAAIGFALSGEMTPLEAPFVILLAIVALAGAIHVAEAASAGFRGARWLAYLGRISMAIYLGHTIFSAAFRSLLLGLGVDQVWILLLVEVAVGLAGPAVLDWGARRLRMSRLLGF